VGAKLLQQIIDRRLSGKNKSVGNRERFLRRHKEQIREAVRRAVDGRGIRDLEKGEDVHIPKRDLSQPVFGHGQGGKREAVHPGNSEYVTGDRIKRPDGGGQGQGGSQASDSGEGEDDFVFHLTKEEFMQAFFDDLALPNLTRTQLAEIPEYKSHRAGFVNDGTPSNLSIVRSMRGALGRRIALSADSRRELHEAEQALALLEEQGAKDDVTLKHKAELQETIKRLRSYIDRVPFLDPLDLKFRNRVKVPVPSTRAVMFCVMDVSGSMDESRKDLAKRFFILLYLFLTRHYEKIEVVFIRHHTRAEEVDEDTFFHSTESGGTVVSSALELMKKIMDERYSPTEWNIYGAQASDGDNWTDDSPKCRKLLSEDILPKVRYFAYIQVAPEEQNLWLEYAQLALAAPELAMKKVESAADIYPVFRELFEKQQAAA